MEVTNKELVSAGNLKPNFSATTIMYPIRYKQFNRSLVAVYSTSKLREAIEAKIAKIAKNMDPYNKNKMVRSLVPILEAIEKIEKGKE
jgi:hypothetical protein